MQAKTQRTYILVFSLTCILTAIGLTLYALSDNITFFYTPSDLKSKNVAIHQNVRLGGMVVQNSVLRDGLLLKFMLTDFKEQINIEFEGIAPDLFREGQGIVAEGYLKEDGWFKANTLLAKHDENYMPPELSTLEELKN